ncbi:hypothetical protein DL96DRAFT_1712607 [Flagelloscypha sp. PMI_526]|nr:hypothetical protein DL96DRAFT_1712607 [Flagelloscypha sp. PMI_526]
MSTASQLPLEIVQAILSHLDPSNSPLNRKTLLACCTLSQNVSRVALSALYWTVIITNSRRHLSILECPHLSLIKHLKILNPPNNEMHHARILQVFTDHSQTLKSIHLVGETSSSKLWESLEKAIVSSPQLRSKLKIGIIIQAFEEQYYRIADIMPRDQRPNELTGFKRDFPVSWACLNSLQVDDGWETILSSSTSAEIVIPALDTLVLGYASTSGWTPSSFVDTRNLRALSFGDQVPGYRVTKILQELGGGLEVLAVGNPSLAWDITKFNYPKLQTLILHFTTSPIQWVYDVVPFVQGINKVGPAIESLHISLCLDDPMRENTSYLRAEIRKHQSGMAKLAPELLKFPSLTHMGFWFYENINIGVGPDRKRNERVLVEAFCDFAWQRGHSLEFHWEDRWVDLVHRM